MDICTIVARNYLAHARVLASSFLGANPGGSVYVMLLDDEEEVIGHDEQFVVIRPGDLDIDRREFHRMAMIYDVMELATAVKPWLLRCLLDRGLKGVAYLDPDIKVYSGLGDLDALVAEYGLVLTPHVLRPLPRDGKRPSEADILISGTYNLGFVAVGQAGRPFLSWWEERLARDCRRDIAGGIFVDQRWIDLAVHIFVNHSLRDETVNVAYWNLDQRNLERGVNGYQVNDQPLRFFHFSGFDPFRPNVVSKHMGNAPRHIPHGGALLEILEEYASDLMATGYGEWSSAPYRYGETRSGVLITRTMRDEYRRELLLDDHEAKELPDPFDLAEVAAMSRWTGQWRRRHAGELLIGEERLVRSQVRLAREAGRALAAWGREAFPSGVRRREDVGGVSKGASNEDPVVAGINVVGNLRAESGVGELARRAVMVLHAAAVPCSLFVNPITASRQAAEVPTGDSRQGFGCNLLCANADQLPALATLLGPSILRRRYNIGYWAWELSTFPSEMAASERYLDEIWALSDHAAEAIRMTVSKPVRSFPPPIPPPVPACATRAALGLDEGYLFFFCFDFLSSFERKNPMAVIDAFRRAFPEPSGATLLVKSVNGHLRATELARLRQHASGRPDIVVRDESLTALEQDELMEVCDAYVSLHRAEGFGLTMAEAMSRGKPVIATGYSGNLEFMSDENSFLVPYTLTAVGSGNAPYPPEAMWANPDTDAAAEMMKAVLDDPVEAHRRGEQAARDISDHHSVEARAELLTDLLQPAAQSPKSGHRRARRRLASVDGNLARAVLAVSGNAKWRWRARRVGVAVSGVVRSSRRTP